MICMIYDLIHVALWDRYNLRDHKLPVLALYCTDPAQHLITAG